ncbi:hypothetical protein P4C99_02525 [Pontiellaceae bacterium B1224]|nr:hypothetical protein [Pontiellaceae bacterium B1224]
MLKKIYLMGCALLMASPVFAANNCLTFDGVDDWVNTVSAGGIPLAGDFTVECWAKCETNSGAYTEILSQGSVGNALVPSLARLDSRKESRHGNRVSFRRLASLCGR